MNVLSELKEGLAISWSAIRANKLRSVLTTLGIIIGIVTVTLMGTAIEGLNRAFVRSFSFIGADVLYVGTRPWAAGSEDDWLKMRKRRPITVAQGEELEREFTLCRAITPMAVTQRPIRYAKRSARVVIVGSTEQLLVTGGAALAEGRFLSAADAAGGRPVCVLGSLAATNLFLRDSPVGKKITIDQRSFEVVGVLEKQGGLFTSGFDNQAIIPLRQFTTLFVNRSDLDHIQIKVSEMADLDNTVEELHSVMRRVRRLAPTDADDFAINQQSQLLSRINALTAVIATVGLCITSLSLFVGGIGIMNIMFVSVAERTREIGIRKAIGAKRRTILLQFLMEAATICLIGGAAGVGIAWPLTLLLKTFMPASMSPTIVGLALLVSVATGLISGFIPAWRAARMNPVDALRNE